MHKASLSFKKLLLWTEHHGNLPMLRLEQRAQGKDAPVFWIFCSQLTLRQTFSVDEQCLFLFLPLLHSELSFN